MSKSLTQQYSKTNFLIALEIDKEKKEFKALQNNFIKEQQAKEYEYNAKIAEENPFYENLELYLNEVIDLSKMILNNQPGVKELLEKTYFKRINESIKVFKNDLKIEDTTKIAKNYMNDLKNVSEEILKHEEYINDLETLQKGISLFEGLIKKYTNNLISKKSRELLKLSFN